MKQLISLFLFSLFASSLSAQVPYRIVIDSKQSPIFGVENTISFQKAFYTLEDELVPLKLGKENTLIKKGIGAGYRFAKLILLDTPIEYGLALIQHEVYGHGARYREAGFRNNSYEFTPPPPYGAGSGLARAGTLETDIVVSGFQSMLNILGGNEANIALSDHIQARVLLKNSLHYHEALGFLGSKNNLAWYIWRDKLSDFGGDIKSYVNAVNNLPSERDEFYDMDRLAKQSLISLLNPLQWYAGFTLGKTYVLEGKSTLEGLPTIRLSENRWLPSIGYNLTPFGSEFIFDHYLMSNQKMHRIRLAIGDNLRNDFYRLEVQGFGIIHSEKLFVSSGFSFWRQPAFTMGGKGLIKQVDAGIGFLVNAEADWFPSNKFKRFGLHTHLTYKTDGYVIGEPLGDGLNLRFGLSFQAE